MTNDEGSHADGAGAQQGSLNPTEAAADTSGTAYLLECFRTAREELMFRVRHRDYWLLVQLVAQALLLALAQGVTVGGVAATRPYPELLALAPAVSFVFATLYFVEDGLIGHLGRYIGAISASEAQLSQRGSVITNWDSSHQLRDYGKSTLPVRFLGQVVAFIFIPAGLLASRVLHFSSWGVLQGGEVAADIVLLLVTAFIAVRSYRFRNHRTPDTAPTSLLVPAPKAAEAAAEERTAMVEQMTVLDTRRGSRLGLVVAAIFAAVVVLVVVGLAVLIVGFGLSAPWTH